MGVGGLAGLYYVQRMQLNKSHVQDDTPVRWRVGGGLASQVGDCICRERGDNKMERASHVCTKLCQVDKAVLVAPS